MLLLGALPVRSILAAGFSIGLVLCPVCLEENEDPCAFILLVSLCQGVVVLYSLVYPMGGGYGC